MNVLAFDFGASSGRAILGAFENGKIILKELHRFDNEPVELNGGFYWDLPRLFHEVKVALKKADEYDYVSLGVDTWGVDYALISNEGKILGNPYNYRDGRTNNTIKELSPVITEKELYNVSGIQNMNFNTIFQLVQTKKSESSIYAAADKFILIADLFGYLLTGKIYSEKTMASTSQLLNPYTKEWNFELAGKVGIKESLFPSLVNPGELIGSLKKEICEELNIKNVDVVAVCGHDTASAVVAVPALNEDFVYISCGTWSLFGTELDSPCITDSSADFNITNETGYNNTTRFLKNIIGLWMIQETRRQFARDGKSYSYAQMEEMAKKAKPFKCFIDPDDPRFTPAGNQVQRIKDFCKETNQPIPETDGEIVRCIYESLAMKYKYSYEKLIKCTGKKFSSINMIGGGTKDGFLCQMTADACGVPVIAGPIEATAIGNIAVQLIAKGEIKDLKEARKIIADSFDVIHYESSDSGFNENYENFLKIVL